MKLIIQTEYFKFIRWFSFLIIIHFPISKYKLSIIKLLTAKKQFAIRLIFLAYFLDFSFNWQSIPSYPTTIPKVQ